ncbi:MAG: 30S ribosomal protein S9 [Patescibacteria group bacterium]|mgnify:CR=1 FL=1
MTRQSSGTSQNNKEVIASKQDYISAIGRRKSSRALVRLYKSDTVVAGITIHRGEIFVNNKSALEYFGKDKELIYKEPLNITGSQDFSISVRVSGGGKMGQLSATVLGIARALDKLDREKFHTILKKKGMFTRDPRTRQRRKVGMGGKSRRRKQSPKR